MLTLSFAGHDPYQSLAPIQKSRLLTLGSRCTCSAANRPSVTQRAEQRIEPVELRCGLILRGRIDQMHALGGRRAVDRLMAFVRRNVSGPQAGGSNSGSQASALSAVSQTAKSSGIGWMRQHARGFHGRAQLAAVDGARIDERVLAQDDDHLHLSRITIMAPMSRNPAISASRSRYLDDLRAGVRFRPDPVLASDGREIGKTPRTWVSRA